MSVSDAIAHRRMARAQFLKASTPLLIAMYAPYVYAVVLFRQDTDLKDVKAALLLTALTIAIISPLLCALMIRRLNDAVDSRFNAVIRHGLILVFGFNVLVAIVYGSLGLLLYCEESEFCRYYSRALNQDIYISVWSQSVIFLAGISDAILYLVVIFSIFPGQKRDNRFGVTPERAYLSSRLQSSFENERLINARIAQRLHDLAKLLPADEDRLQTRLYKSLSLYTRLGLISNVIISHILFVIGYFLLAIGIYAFPKPGKAHKIFEFLSSNAVIETKIYFLIFLCIPFVLIITGLFSVKMSWRIFTPVKVMKAIVGIKIEKPCILYLRPFSSDGYRSIIPFDRGSIKTSYRPTLGGIMKLMLTKPAYVFVYALTYIPLVWNPYSRERQRAKYSAGNNSRVTVEEFLEVELDEVGQLVALGVNDIGVARIPSADVDWEFKLLWLIAQSSCILYVPAPSFGSLRELEIIFDHHLDKTVFVGVPAPDLAFGKRRALFYGKQWQLAMQEFKARRPEHAALVEQMSHSEDGVLYLVRGKPKSVVRLPLTSDILKDTVCGVVSRPEPASEVMKGQDA